jgi:myo-inositol-1-phosphate synthase
MSRISGAGSFGYGPNIHDETQSEFDVDARRSLDGLGPVKAKLSAEQIKQAFEEAQREDQRVTTNKTNADEFLSCHPEFIDTTKNAKLMNETLSTMFGDGTYTVGQFEQAFAVLRPTGVLELDKAEIARQRQEAADAQRKATIKRRTDAAAKAFNPNADYENLTLEEIRDRANEELRIGGEQQGAVGF